MPDFKFTKLEAVTSWSNFHGTIVNRPVPMFLTPAPMGDTSTKDVPLVKRQTNALNEILQYCLSAKPPERVCTVGATWSLSDVLSPANVVIFPDAFDAVVPIEQAMITPAYAKAAALNEGVPIIVEGGIKIHDLNEALGHEGLALQTSGANDGHRLAGCIATGTHGSAISIGAVHDAVRAMFLVTGPNQAVLLQPTERNFTPALAAWFQAQTGFSTKDDANDDRFNAALVALGGLGFIHSVIVEAVPLYQLYGQVLPLAFSDPKLWAAIETLDTNGLVPSADKPYHFAVMINPYADPMRPTGTFVALMWKQKAQGQYAAPDPVTVLRATDTTKVMGAMLPIASVVLPAAAFEPIMNSIVDGQFSAGPIPAMFPGQAFGPTSLPRGVGRSTELAFDHKDARRAITTIVSALKAEGQQGRHLLAVLGVRFVPGTKALLGTNQRAMNMYVEVPSIGTFQSSAIQQAVWQALRDAKVPFTCHWGQEYDLSPADLQAYFGDNVAKWKAARATLLPTPEQRAVFTTPQLKKVGLD